MIVINYTTFVLSFVGSAQTVAPALLALVTLQGGMLISQFVILAINKEIKVTSVHSAEELIELQQCVT